MSNPVLKESFFNEESLNDNGNLELGRTMTGTGTLTKTLFLGLLLALTYGYTWELAVKGFADKVSLLVMAGFFGGFIMSLIIMFTRKSKMLMFTTPIYAMLEGLCLGGISVIINQAYPGVASQAIIGTMATILGMYFLYASRIIKVTQTFYKVVLISTFAIFCVYMLQFVLSFFHITIPGLYSNDPIGIVISVIIVIVAALNLVLDYDWITNHSGVLPDYYEWYGAFSLMVTIVWLYIEMLKLFAKINSRR